MDKLYKHDNISEDERLSLFMEKGFLLWSLGKLDMTINLFSLKNKVKYSNGDTFIDRLKLRYSFYKDQNVIFPDQKKTWKKIKKLK